MLPYAAIPSRVICDPALTAHGFRVYCLLATYADKDGWCWPSLRALATRYGVTRQAIHQHITHLVELKHVERRKLTLPSGATVTAYRPLLDLDRKAARGVFTLQAANKAKGKGKPSSTALRPSSLADKAVKSDLTMEVNTLKKKSERASAPPPEWSALKALLTSSALGNQPNE